MSRCPVCLDPEGLATPRTHVVRFECPRCGVFYGPADLESQLLTLFAEKRAAASAALHRSQPFVFWERSALRAVEALLRLPPVPAAA
jgi:hypothetical protein